MKMLRYALLSLCGISSIASLAQTSQLKKEPTYPKNYFQIPLKIPIELAGNFGEVRPNHFHSGMDIKTQGKENLPVYAAADGYISRIKLEKGGFGHALYITHPNGFTTLYAHLNDFAPKIQKYLTEQQYKNKSWMVDLLPDPSAFPIKKGEQIAWSGNTGGSTAPHLHFEIRNTADQSPLNPQLFGFKINDNIAPKVTKIAIYDLTKGVYEQTPRIFEVREKGGIYKPVNGDTIKVPTEQTGVAVAVNDYMNGSDNTLAFYTAKLYLVDAMTITVRLNNINYDYSRFVNAYQDYKTKKLTGTTFQCLFQQDGNSLDSIYEYSTDYRRYTQRGRLEEVAHQVKEARIELKDVNGNVSNISFYLQYEPEPQPAKPACEHIFQILKTNSYSNENVAVIMKPNSIYENICFESSSKPDPNSLSDRYMIGQSYIPVQNYFDLYINPHQPVSNDLLDKVALVYTDGKDESGQRAYPSDGWFKALVRNLGEYRLVLDTKAPTITSENKADIFATGQYIRFNVKEDITSVQSFSATVDSKWLCFEQKGNTFEYKVDEHCPAGKHVLVVTAQDENGNTNTLNYSFTKK